MKLPTTRDGKPVLDEATFQKLLAAAYVLQQHQERTRAAQEATRATQEPDSEYAHTLAEIIETQHQILVRHLDLDGASGYVVEQLQRITSGAGAAVGLLDHDHLVYRAVTGVSASELGSALPKEKALSSVVLTQAMVLRCPNVRGESNVDQEIAKRAGIASFVAVPIFHDDHVAGVLELVFRRGNGFTEYDVHTCQMMAGLVTEALARDEDEKWKRSLAAERDSMLQALEKLKPQLDRLAKDAELLSSSAAPKAMRGGAAPVAPEAPFVKPAARSVPAPAPVRQTQRSSVAGESECHKCGNPLGDAEVYCGSCGTLRSERPVNGQRAIPEQAASKDLPLDLNDLGTYDSPQPLSARMAKQEFELPPEVLALVNEEPKAEPIPDIADELLKLLPPEDWEGQSLAKPEPAVKTESAMTGYPWTSAAHARAWLNTMSDPKAGSGLMEFMRVHRGDVSLVAAILLVLVAIFWSRTERVPSPVNANTNVTTSASSASSAAGAATSTSEEADPPDPQAQLSLWDRTLIALGLAEAPVIPRAPQPMGSPDARVWVDLHTALYYCGGADLYGKTPKGRYTTQREAQSERFEPASGKVCQ
jgi:GAF domain-containing protein